MLALSITPREAAAAAGDPVPGADVSLEQIPGGIAFHPAVPECTVPNTVVEGGLIPACGPARTFNQLAGSPPNGWIFRAKTKVKLAMKPGKNKVVDPLNPLTDAADVSINLKMGGIEDSFGPVSSGPGTLFIVVRTSLDDRAGGSMTMVDFPFFFGFTVAGGKASLKTSLNVQLNLLGQPGLPGSFSMLLVDAQILDPNGNQFAAPGGGIAIP
jgi:hypothetical protein